MQIFFLDGYKRITSESSAPRKNPNRKELSQRCCQYSLIYHDIVPQIIDLYFEHLDWPRIQMMLKSLSGQQDKWKREDGKIVSPIKNFHLIRLLRERLFSINDKNYRARKEIKSEKNDGEWDAKPTQIDAIRHLVAYAYELRQLFPYASTQYETFYETLYEYNQLFSKCIKLRELTVESVNDCLELLRTLIKLEFIALHPNETVSATIIENVLNRFGWMPAVNTWMALQSGFYASNGIVPLLTYVTRGIDQNPQKATDLQYVLHKAQNFLPASRVHTIYAAILVSLRKYTEAIDYTNKHKTDMDSPHIVLAFRLINNLRATKKLNNEFVYKFSEIMLEHSRLKEDPEQCLELQKDFLKLCETKKLGRFALQLFELFDKMGIQIDSEHQDKIMKVANRQAELEKIWLFKPNGLLSLSEEDEIVKSSDFWKRFDKYSNRETSPPST
ncbi:unnamed protein product, partial [Mesorhabditis belari]|uniref:Uncharacterized protein n=1 Tax=Mesorhabditis belari TaxID=2138241 RepID=A0AAF3F837_9BILA